MLSDRASPHTPEDIHGFRGYLEDEYEHCRISLPREQPAWPADQANLYSAKKKKNNAFARDEESSGPVHLNPRTFGPATGVS